jgi:lipid II:glycine glycyltransferase (peptidoglycan interpeptide bridge formation enzyme)
MEKVIVITGGTSGIGLQAAYVLSQKGCRVYDFRGVPGDVGEDHPLYGLVKFKRGFNGDYTEFVGEMDLVLNKFWYKTIEKSTSVFKEVRKKAYLIKNKGK